MSKISITKNKTSWIIFSLLLFIFLTVTYKLTYKSTPSSKLPIKTIQDTPCDLRKKDCSKKLASGGEVIFSIEPKDIPMLKSLSLNIKLKGINPTKVEIDFMQQDDALSFGYNRPELEKVSDTEFKGNGFLSLCANDEMKWEARVLLHTDSGMQTAIYHFMTYKKQPK